MRRRSTSSTRRAVRSRDDRYRGAGASRREPAAARRRACALRRLDDSRARSLARVHAIPPAHDQPRARLTPINRGRRARPPGRRASGVRGSLVGVPDDAGELAHVRGHGGARRRRGGGGACDVAPAAPAAPTPARARAQGPRRQDAAAVRPIAPPPRVTPPPTASVSRRRRPRRARVRLRGLPARHGTARSSRRRRAHRPRRLRRGVRGGGGRRRRAPPRAQARAVLQL